MSVREHVDDVHEVDGDVPDHILVQHHIDTDPLPDEQVLERPVHEDTVNEGKSNHNPSEHARTEGGGDGEGGHHLEVEDGDLDAVDPGVEDPLDGAVLRYI